MAFWGIEVKPGKPYTHHYDQSRGRLRICQATIGNGKSTSKSVVQCNVGDKSPILLCNLIPDTSESCRLELEFEEDEEVVFSVIGQRSVHLSGYYIGSAGRALDGDETDSFGEDIAGSDTSGSYDSLEVEDDYESDFFDDDGVEMFQHSPRRKSGVVIEEIIEDDKPTDANEKGQPPKKKNQLSDSGDSKGQLVIKRSQPSIFDSEDEDGFPIPVSRKRNDAKSNGKVVDENKKPELEATTADVKTAGEPVDVSMPDIGAESDGKSKKTKKKGKKSKSDATVPVEEKANEAIDTGSVGKVENSKEEVLEKENQTIDSESVGKVPASTEPEKSTTDNTEENSVKSKKKKNRKRKAKDNKSEETNNTVDATEQPSNKTPDVEAEITTDSDKKTAKKKKKNKKSEKDSSDDSDEELLLTASKPRIFPNGLVIEDIAMGKADARKAADGRKVFVNYIGKLKKNGAIFDSNVGKRPFSFRLGVGEVIKGWDVGVKGMRVGDKRRLTIPPSFAYGEKNMGKIPANSWLVFDVELVGVK